MRRYYCHALPTMYSSFQHSDTRVLRVHSSAHPDSLDGPHLRLVLPLGRVEDDLEAVAVKRANGARQVVEALEARHGQVLVGVAFLVQVPRADEPSLAREEDVDVDAAVAARGEGHADAVRLPDDEGI